MRNSSMINAGAYRLDVYAGPCLDGASVFDLLENEQCSTTAAVPTVWLGLLQHMRAHNLRLTTLKSCVIGGSAAPLSMIKAFQEGACFHISGASCFFLISDELMCEDCNLEYCLVAEGLLGHGCACASFDHACWKSRKKDPISRNLARSNQASVG